MNADPDAATGLPARTWLEIWQQRRVDGIAEDRVLASLMRADGFDTFGELDEAAWRRFVGAAADGLDLGAGDTVFEVGCGAGAFLYPLYERGCRVAGLNLSEPLIEVARRVMPDGEFVQGDARQITPGRTWDAVVSCGVFLYFPALADARLVLERMAAAATRGLAILDVPDRATEPAALAARRAALGDAAYAARYSGLEHLYYDREWFRDTLTALGFASVQITAQTLEGYAHAPYRFNVTARRRALP